MTRPDSVDVGRPQDAGSASPFARRPPARPRPRPDVLAAVFVGGCAGGALRYVATSADHSTDLAFPWATLIVNVAGAFVLAVVIALAAQVVRSRYLRPLIGTGFCGALTTFSAVVVVADRMLMHHRVGLAAAYVAATAAGGLAAAAIGLLLGRAVLRSRPRQERSTP